MPAELVVPDDKWRNAAHQAQEALNAFGWTVPPCLPDQEKTCGGKFHEHAGAYYCLLIELCEHQLSHLKPGHEFITLMRMSQRKDVKAACSRVHKS